MSAVLKIEILEPIDEKYRPVAQQAFDLLGIVRANNNLGFEKLSIDDFTPYEFELMAYLSLEVSKLERQMQK